MRRDGKAGAGALSILLVLSVGVTGHRGLDWQSDRWKAVEASVGKLLDSMSALARKASSFPFFAPAPVPVRVVSMLAEGADQLVSEAAVARGLALLAVLPSRPEIYGEAMSGQAGRDGFQSLLSRASGVTVLTEAAVGDASFDMANDFILMQSDLLIAVWGGLLARGPGGTGEVIQKALERGIAVFVVETEPSRGG